MGRPLFLSVEGESHLSRILIPQELKLVLREEGLLLELVELLQCPLIDATSDR